VLRADAGGININSDCHSNSAQDHGHSTADKQYLVQAGNGGGDNISVNIQSRARRWKPGMIGSEFLDALLDLHLKGIGLLYVLSSL
jgi:hypothetical protein